MASGCEKFASAPPSRRKPLSQATSAAGIFTRAKKWIDAYTSAVHQAAVAKPDSRSIARYIRPRKNVSSTTATTRPTRAPSRTAPASSAASNSGRSSWMPSACIAIDIGSMVATPIPRPAANCPRNCGSRHAVAPVVAPAQPEPAHREQEGEQQDELPEPADDAVEGPVRLERVDSVPGRKGEQRREQQRAEDDAEESERRAHQRSRAMAVNVRRAASIVASISAAPWAALTNPAS